MMDFITAPLIVGIITLGIYKLFELFACRRERITLIEKLGEKMSQTDLELNGKICLPDFNRPQLSFGALKGGCLLLGVGLGLLVGFILAMSVFLPTISTDSTEGIPARWLGSSTVRVPFFSEEQD